MDLDASPSWLDPVVGQDTRRTVRVFLACSHSLAEERKRFPEALARISARPDISRSHRLHAVRWEKDASGAAHLRINDSISASTDFESIDVVVVIVWDRVGDGTREEYRRALQLLRTRGKPQVLVYMRSPPGGLLNPHGEELDLFREQVIADGVVPSVYDHPDEFIERLAEHLPRWLPRPEQRDPGPPATLRQHFVLAASGNFVLAVATIALCSTMRFPDGGVSEQSVLAVLVAPVVIFFTTFLAATAYQRVLSSLAHVWHSPAWTDEHIYEVFRGIVPGCFLPQRLVRHFPRSNVILTASLVLSLLGGVLAQHDCVFREILVWDYVVGFEVRSNPAGSPIRDSKGNLVMVHVDRGRKPWPFGLQDASVREACANERKRTGRWDCVIYVYAPGRFAAEKGQEFRSNLGPEVWLPVHSWGYFGFFIASFFVGARPLWRLARLKRELAGS